MEQPVARSEYSVQLTAGAATGRLPPPRSPLTLEQVALQVCGVMASMLRASQSCARGSELTKVRLEIAHRAISGRSDPHNPPNRRPGTNASAR